MKNAEIDIGLSHHGVLESLTPDFHYDNREDIFYGYVTQTLWRKCNVNLNLLNQTMRMSGMLLNKGLTLYNILQYSKM